MADPEKIAQLDYDAALADVSERLRESHVFSTAALRTLLLCNGGALIALFHIRRQR